MLVREIHGGQRGCELLYTKTFRGVEVDVVKYLYKGKDAVFFAFERKFPHRPLLTCLELASVDSLIMKIRSADKIEKSPKFNLIKLKILKLI